MSSADQLARNIAELIRAEETSGLAVVLKRLDAIDERLENLEAADRAGNFGAPAGSSVHPSLDKFAIAEAIADVVIAGKEKACTFEPNGKPCDHCSMCSSRGF